MESLADIAITEVVILATFLIIVAVREKRFLWKAGLRSDLWDLLSLSDRQMRDMFSLIRRQETELKELRREVDELKARKPAWSDNTRIAEPKEKFEGSDTL